MDIQLLHSLCNVYIKFIRSSNKLNSDTYELKDNTKCYGFIPQSDTGHVVLVLEEVFKQLNKIGIWNPKFLDIGCGIGNIVLLARALGYDSTGLEYDLKTYRLAKKLCILAYTKIIKGDMRKFDKYHEYDLLYYYEPIHDRKAMNEFATNLTKQMKYGAYILAEGPLVPYSTAIDFHQVPGFRGSLWQKKKTIDKK